MCLDKVQSSCYTPLHSVLYCSTAYTHDYLHVCPPPREVQALGTLSLAHHQPSGFPKLRTMAALKRLAV